MADRIGLVRPVVCGLGAVVVFGAAVAVGTGVVAVGIMRRIGGAT